MASGRLGTTRSRLGDGLRLGTGGTIAPAPSVAGGGIVLGVYHPQGRKVEVTVDGTMRFGLVGAAIPSSRRVQALTGRIRIAMTGQASVNVRTARQVSGVVHAPSVTLTPSYRRAVWADGMMRTRGAASAAPVRGLDLLTAQLVSVREALRESQDGSGYLSRRLLTLWRRADLMADAWTRERADVLDLATILDADPFLLAEADDPTKKRPQDYLADWEDEDTATLPDDANHDQRREALIAPLALRLVRRLTTLARDAQSTDHGHAGFADQIAPTLTSIYIQAYLSGAQSFTGDWALDADAEDEIAQLVAGQMPYLSGFARDIVSGALSDAQMAFRLSQYGNGPVRQAFNAGRGQAMQDAGVERYVWNAMDGCCEMCCPRDGVVYTLDTLPGMPGDGDFGSELCLGGPNCRCWLEEAGEDES